MDLLRLVTLVYAGLLVTALAFSLIAIWLYLRRIGRALAAVREELQQVGGHTQKLKHPLETLAEGTADAARSLKKASVSLEGSREWLESLAERRGVLATKSPEVDR